MNFVGNAASKETRTALLAVRRGGRKPRDERSGAERQCPGSPARLSAVAAPRSSGGAAPVAALAAHGRGVPGPAGSRASCGGAARAECGAGPGCGSAARSCGAAGRCAGAPRGRVSARFLRLSVTRSVLSEAVRIKPSPEPKAKRCALRAVTERCSFVPGGAENHSRRSLNQTSRRKVSVQSEAMEGAVCSAEGTFPPPNRTARNTFQFVLCFGRTSCVFITHQLYICEGVYSIWILFHVCTGKL